MSWTPQKVARVQRCLMDRLTEYTPPKHLVGHDDQFQAVYKLIEATVTTGESNSALLIGNRGTGKTMLIRRALEDLHENHPRHPFHVVSLSGLIHTDDRLALKEITRTLQVENVLDAHTGSFAEQFLHVFSALRDQNKDTTPIVFILDEFDLFADHPKQALLYNLFDMVQSNANTMVVIGLTCRYDVMDTLEKRVKSRFSWRQICLHSPQTMATFRDIIEQTLTIEPGDVDDLEEELITEFNESIEAFLNDTQTLAVMKRIFDIERDVRQFFKISMAVVATMSMESLFLSPAQLYDVYLTQKADSKTLMLCGLSVLEFCLMIAIKKKLELADTFNFEMVFQEYSSFAVVHNMAFKKAVALKAFETLISLELIVPCESVSKCPKEFRMMMSTVHPAQISDAAFRMDTLNYFVKSNDSKKS